MTHDPLLDGVTRWSHEHPTECVQVRYEYGTWVHYNDLPALIAKVREDERGKVLWPYSDAYEQGQRDEREAIDAEITADLTARIQREREDRDPDLLLGGIDYALQNVLRVIRARGES